MAEVAWGTVVFLWTLAALFIRVPEQSIPLFPSLGFQEEWEERCHRIHGDVQRGMRAIYGTLAATAALAGVVFTFLHFGVWSAVAPLLLALTTIAAGPRTAERCERTKRLRLKEWLQAAEASKYRVTPTPPPKT